MRTSTLREAAVFLGFVLVCAVLPNVGSTEQPGGIVKLNRKAFEYAQELIKQGHVIADSHGDWSQHQPSAEEENEFIRQHGLEEYAKWHLGVDERYAENTKARYKFPYGDFKDVHRCALLAARSRAAQYRHYDIENAAGSLAGIIGSRSPARIKP
jgi:hypothetical protein